MYGINLDQLASIEQQITRTTAMLDACQRHNAPAEAIAELNSRLYTYRAEKNGILGKGIQIDTNRLAAKAAMVEKILEALDPDQAESVSWWAN